MQFYFKIQVLAIIFLLIVVWYPYAILATNACAQACAMAGTFARKNTFAHKKSLPQRGCGKSKDVNRQLHLLTGNHLPKKKVLNYIIHLTFALV